MVIVLDVEVSDNVNILRMASVHIRLYVYCFIAHHYCISYSGNKLNLVQTPKAQCYNYNDITHIYTQILTCEKLEPENVTLLLDI